jgi:hypothetical protein
MWNSAKVKSNSEKISTSAELRKSISMDTLLSLSVYRKAICLLIPIQWIFISELLDSFPTLCMAPKNVYMSSTLGHSGSTGKTCSAAGQASQPNQIRQLRSRYNYKASTKYNNMSRI